jgi:hypothetical protein
MDEEINVGGADWANRLMRDVKTRRKITVEDGDWENRALWVMEIGCTDYCGQWRLGEQITVGYGD